MRHTYEMFGMIGLTYCDCCDLLIGLLRQDAGHSGFQLVCQHNFECVKNGPYVIGYCCNVVMLQLKNKCYNCQRLILQLMMANGFYLDIC